MENFRHRGTPSSKFSKHIEKSDSRCVFSTASVLYVGGESRVTLRLNRFADIFTCRPGLARSMVDMNLLVRTNPQVMQLDLSETKEHTTKLLVRVHIYLSGSSSVGRENQV